MEGINCPPIVDIELTDLPKTRGCQSTSGTLIGDTPAKLEHKAQVLFSDPYLVCHDTENSSDFTHMPRDATISKTGKITVLPRYK